MASWPHEQFTNLKSLKATDAMNRLRQLVAGMPETSSIEWKRTNPLDGGKRLHRDDVRNLARTVSAFANSQGGILVFGVDDSSRDLALISDLGRFHSLVQDALGFVIDPYVPGVDCLPVYSDDNKGVLLIYVPESFDGPHQISVTDSPDQFRYMRRTEGRLRPMTHRDVAVAFSKRRLPLLQLTKTSPKFTQTHDVPNDPTKRGAFEFEFWGENVGGAYAAKAFCRLKHVPMKMPLVLCPSAEFTSVVTWENRCTRSVKLTGANDSWVETLALFEDVAWIPPTGLELLWYGSLAVTQHGGWREVLGSLTLQQHPPFSFDWVLGSEGSGLSKGTITVTADELAAALSKFLAANPSVK